MRMITVGRLHSIKGYGVLIDACRQLRCEGVELELEMIGDGPAKEWLQTQVLELGLEGYVRLAGAVGQDVIGMYFDRADIIVISSFMEGVPVVLMESMAKELGVVSTRVGGVPELVEDGVSGYLVDPGSSASLLAAIKKYASDLSLCRTHGEQGRQMVCTEYSIEETAARMAELFDRYVPCLRRTDS